MKWSRIEHREEAMAALGVVFLFLVLSYEARAEIEWRKVGSTSGQGSCVSNELSSDGTLGSARYVRCIQYAQDDCGGAEGHWGRQFQTVESGGKAVTTARCVACRRPQGLGPS